MRELCTLSSENLNQPFRQGRDYSFFGPFRFELEQHRPCALELTAKFRAGYLERIESAYSNGQL